MSNFFQDLEKATQRFTTKVSSGVSCAALEQRIGEHYRELGRLYYDASTRGVAPEGEAFRVQMDQIRQLRQELEFKKNQ